MSLLADLLSTMFDRNTSYRSKIKYDQKPISDLILELISNKGEVTGMTLARQIINNYREMKWEEKLDFFNILAYDMDIDASQVKIALKNYSEIPSKASYGCFMIAAEPKRQELLRRLNQLPGSTADLVLMRKDLLKFAKENPQLAALDLDFKHLFISWFNRGFLVLRPINWRSPANILEKIIKYEAVHSIDSWDDLRRRLEPVDRRCFAFFHPSMPDDPLIFVEVALTNEISNSIQNILMDSRKTLELNEVNTAVFYSISNCQQGLAGISFGNSLIKQVVKDLSTELPYLTKFITLSPIPKFTYWLDNIADPYLLKNQDLRQLAAYYLTEAKDGNATPYDPVAKFHLSNGAEIHALHLDADISDNGMAQSGGVMVNYLYDLSAIESNHERYTNENEIPMSSNIRNLAQVITK